MFLITIYDKKNDFQPPIINTIHFSACINKRLIFQLILSLQIRKAEKSFKNQFMNADIPAYFTTTNFTNVFSPASILQI